MVTTNFQPIVQEDELARVLGASGSKTTSFATRQRINNWNDRLSSFTAPRLTYCTQKIRTIQTGRVVLENGVAFRSVKLAKTLRDCHDAICFIATIGGDMDLKIDRYMKKGHYADAYILDAMGSVSVETGVEQFHRRMRKQLKAEGRCVSHRFSPGYCDWSVKEQKKLFNLFSGAKLGVKLTDSCLMLPRKSISGVFGIYDLAKRPVDPPYNPCQDCSKKDCRSRRRS